MDGEYSNQTIARTADPVNCRCEEFLPAEEPLRSSGSILPETLAKPDGFNLSSPAEFLLRAVVALIAPSLLWSVESFCLSLSTLHASGFKAMLIESARSTIALRRYARVCRLARSK